MRNCIDKQAYNMCAFPSLDTTQATAYHCQSVLILIQLYDGYPVTIANIAIQPAVAVAAVAGTDGNFDCDAHTRPTCTRSGNRNLG